MSTFNCYSPRIVEYKVASAITKGHAVMISGASTMEDPTPGLDLTVPIPTIASCTASAPEDFIGVAMDTASDAGDMIRVCTEGVVYATFDSSHAIAAGDRVTVTDAAGELGECGSAALAAIGIAVEADAGGVTTEEELIRIYIPPRAVGAASAG